MRARIAAWVLAHRRLSWGLFVAITVFFALGLPRVELETVFSDLLPTNDPYVAIYRDHPDFGSPLTVWVMVKRRDGDIYNAETLGLVWRLTRDIDLAPGVDHDQILSITTEKARYSEATPYGIDMRPLMGDAAPTTPEQIARFRANVDLAPNVRTFLISPDDRATLISATFIESRVDYGEAFAYVQGLVEAARDERHEVHLAGQPVLFGWVYKYEAHMVGIFAITLAALVLALVIYTRSAVGVLAPIITSATAAIWAFGLVGWLGISIEPLLMVVPLLLTARSFSHGVQFTERFYEVYAEVGDRHRAAEITMRVMMAPSVLSIVTDVLGIFVVVAAPIPAMVKHAVFCGMWAVWLIPTGVVLISLLLASLPPPKQVRALVDRNAEQGLRRRLQQVLGGLAALSTGRAVPITATVVLLFGAWATWQASQIRIGNPVEGTNLLWDDAEFNVAVRTINQHFPGVNTLEVILESYDREQPLWLTSQAHAIQTLQDFQILVESAPHAPRATLSFADYQREANRLFAGGNPKWLPLDPRDRSVGAATVAVLMGSSAKSYNHVVSEDMQVAAISLWFRDNTQDTVDAALAVAHAAADALGTEHDTFRLRVASGTIALQQAVNSVVERYHGLVVLLLNLFVFLTCWFAYRSPWAGLLLLVPVNLSHQVMVAAMHLMGVGLDVNSMIVAAIGVGVGIDYGIYLLSRICEELRTCPDAWDAAIRDALGTTGRAILFTATIMTLGILPWYLLSEIRFVADMGLLLVVIMLINMVMSLNVVPLLVRLFQPGFVRRQRWVGGR